ncbi:putative 31.7 kDa protein in traX-finO intergenic region [Fusarium oxysporum f. sp. albedinis]|nr:putative 31.7 kDa protein in traX-finO intergenic region [Fusarium oxysporum f. sp. albedinis]
MPSSQPRGPAHADLTPEGFSRINIVSDFLPLTIPLVLQKVVRDPYVAWDIRSIEIWILLILLCPRLRSLKQLGPNDRGYQILEFRCVFCSSIGAVSVIIAMSWYRNSWAPGLRSLQELALGIGGGMWFLSCLC